MSGGSSEMGVVVVVGVSKSLLLILKSWKVYDK